MAAFAAFLRTRRRHLKAKGLQVDLFQVTWGDMQA